MRREEMIERRETDRERERDGTNRLQQPVARQRMKKKIQNRNKLCKIMVTVNKIGYCYKRRKEDKTKNKNVSAIVLV